MMDEITQMSQIPSLSKVPNMGCGSFTSYLIGVHGV